MVTADDLKQYGKVEQCEEIDGMLHVKITDGFSEINTLKALNTIVSRVGDKYPALHKCVTDENLFLLIIKPSK